jgi:uncharacterized protein YutE (UPF0331/DUF86 family)
MVERDKIENLVHQLRKCTGLLREMAQLEETRFLGDPVAIGAARYYLQVAIETCINMANHIIASGRLRAPRDYRDTFAVLNETGILPDDLTRTMRELAGLRNLLVHLYWEVDDRMVYEGICAELGDFETYVSHILTYLDRTTPPADRES